MKEEKKNEEKLSKSDFSSKCDKRTDTSTRVFSVNEEQKASNRNDKSK